MQRARPVPVFLLAVVLLAALCILTLTLGCNPSPARNHARAIAAEQDARTAWERKNPEAALAACESAERAVASLEEAVGKLGPSRPPDANLQRQLREAQVAARNARKYAETAEQEHEREKRLHGLFARTYSSARGITLNALVPQMAAASARAGEKGLSALSVADQGFAELAWLCSHVPDYHAAPTNNSEWATVACTVRTWSTNPPPELRLALVWTFASIGTSDFALAELESIDPGTISSPESQIACGLTRGAFYSLQGWNRLASSEFERLAPQVKAADSRINGDALVALVHGFEAYNAMMRRDLKTMDAEIAESMRVWPNNPLSVYLTGERLAANGEWEKAAESFEARVAGTEDEWLAKRLAARARELRDGHGSAKSFVLDAPLVLEFGYRTALDKTAESSARKKLELAFSQIRAAAEQLQQKVNVKLKLPGNARGQEAGGTELETKDSQ